MLRYARFWPTLALLPLSTAACGSSELGVESSNEVWNNANNPAFVDATFVYNAQDLPLQGEATPPIPSDYWPTYMDGINARWDGDETMSPIEKYEAAFGRTGVTQEYREEFGIESHTERKACKKDDDCKSLSDGSDCAIPQGKKSGRCIPTWWGICHGWGPYSISEPAAKEPVEYNGVTFYPGDLEALMSFVYSENLPAMGISDRCYKDLSNGDFKKALDTDGRLKHAECRDMNPGAFHVVATNFIGIRGSGFVYDRTIDDQVWNQPVRGYKVTNAKNGKLKEISQAEATELLGLMGASVELLRKEPLNFLGTRKGTIVASDNGKAEFHLSGTGDADLYVRKGESPTFFKFDCRPWTSLSNEHCTIDVKAGETLHWMVADYSLKKTTATLAANVPGGTTQPGYLYNTDAKRFFYVEMDFQYIREASPGHSSNIDNIDNYTSTDKYSYILEADEDGMIVGGEWVGTSRTNHPDFAWWPTGKPGNVINDKLRYDEIKALNDRAAGLSQEPTDEEGTDQ